MARQSSRSSSSNTRPQTNALTAQPPPSTPDKGKGKAIAEPRPLRSSSRKLVPSAKVIASLAVEETPATQNKAKRTVVGLRVGKGQAVKHSASKKSDRVPATARSRSAEGLEPLEATSVAIDSKNGQIEDNMLHPDLRGFNASNSSSGFLATSTAQAIPNHGLGNDGLMGVLQAAVAAASGIHMGGVETPEGISAPLFQQYSQPASTSSVPVFSFEPTFVSTTSLPGDALLGKRGQANPASRHALTPSGGLATNGEFSTAHPTLGTSKPPSSKRTLRQAPPELPPHLRPGDTISSPDNPDKHGCPYCDKVYYGCHARSICRRHQMSKHGIELDVQVKKSRWDNDPDRPTTEIEKHQRTLESKRRWAAKDRQRRRDKKAGLPVSKAVDLRRRPSGGPDEDDEEDFDEDNEGEMDAEGEVDDGDYLEPPTAPVRRLSGGDGRPIQYYQAPPPMYGTSNTTYSAGFGGGGQGNQRNFSMMRGSSEASGPASSKGSQDNGSGAGSHLNDPRVNLLSPALVQSFDVDATRPSSSHSATSQSGPRRIGVYEAIGMQMPTSAGQKKSSKSAAMTKSRSAESASENGLLAPVEGRGRSVPTQNGTMNGNGSAIFSEGQPGTERPQDEEAAALLLSMMSSPAGGTATGNATEVGKALEKNGHLSQIKELHDEESPSKRVDGRTRKLDPSDAPDITISSSSRRLSGETATVLTNAGQAPSDTQPQATAEIIRDAHTDAHVLPSPASEDTFAGLDTLASLAQETTPTRPEFPSFEEVMGPGAFATPGWVKEGYEVDGALDETPTLKRTREEVQSNGQGDGPDAADIEEIQRKRLRI